MRAAYVKSLKEKRSIVQSMKQRLRQRFNLAVSEVEMLDAHTIIVIALASASNDRSRAEAEIQKAVDFVQSHFDVEVIGEDTYIDTI